MIITMDDKPLGELIFAQTAIETGHETKSYPNNSGNWQANDRVNQRSQRNSVFIPTVNSYPYKIVIQSRF